MGSRSRLYYASLRRRRGRLRKLHQVLLVRTKNAAPNIERKIPWRGSTLKGSPDPPAPYTAELAFPHLKFNFPVVLVPAAGTNRLFLGELKGRIYSFPEDPACTKPDLVLDLAPLYPDFTAFYGLVFHPEFDKNRYVYLCYVGKNDLVDGSVVSRFTVSRTDPPVIDPKSEKSCSSFGLAAITERVSSSATTDIFIFRPETAPHQRLLTL